MIKDIDNWIRKCVPYSQRLCSHWPTWPNPVLWLVNLGRPWKWPSRSRIFLGVGVSRPYRVRIISYFGDPSRKCLTKKFKGGGYFFIKYYTVEHTKTTCNWNFFLAFYLLPPAPICLCWTISGVSVSSDLIWRAWVIVIGGGLAWLWIDIRNF